MMKIFPIFQVEINSQLALEISKNIEATEEEARRRFNFWRNYLEYLEDAIFIPGEDKNKLVLIFKNIIVVEFSKTGNAAYIYRREVFEEWYGKHLMQ